jgi:hypothetical protein
MIRGLLSSSSGKEEDEIGEVAKWNKDVVDKDHLKGAVATMKETRTQTMTKSGTKRQMEVTVEAPSRHLDKALNAWLPQIPTSEQGTIQVARA